ncbi:MAG: hypothetical protein EA374_08065 [Acholeplasmatales bacterium]|nr:MAG: hypothetical protein EA374_08065 [Acholeplasmatales bacterium]
MQTRKYYVVTVIVYGVATGLILLNLSPVTVVFSVLALLFYHFALHATHIIESERRQKEEKKTLLYQLDKTQKQTHEAAGRFMTVLEVIDSGLLFIDEHEVIKEVNDTFHRFFAIGPVVNHTYDTLKPIKSLYRVVHDAFLQEIKQRRQIIIDNQSYDVNISPVFEGKWFRGCLVVIHDITPIKTAEMFQKQFTADVSHELKTPLSAVKGISEILLRETDMDAKQRQDFITMIHHETKRLETILSDLLIISKMDRLDYELKRENTAIKALIDESVQLLMPTAHDKQLTLSADIEEVILPVDPVKMRQVVINLIKNGLNYTDTGGVSIQGYQQGTMYRITVKDTGIGIPVSEHNKVFKRFYRLDEARSRASGGSGLGLSIIKNVVQKHGGTIALDSRPGEGATFVVDLPLIPEID